MPTSRTLIFNKPYGVLPCFTDPAGRPTLADFAALKQSIERVEEEEP